MVAWIGRALRDWESRLQKPLSGVRVIELCTMITGPLASMLLADLGADVVKVEVPETGDPFRKHGGTSYSAYFCTYNRNKRSIALDLKSPAGMSAFKALVQAADIFDRQLQARRHGASRSRRG